MEFLVIGLALAIVALGGTVWSWVSAFKRPTYANVTFGFLLFWNALFVLVPHVLIAVRPETETAYHTFVAGESGKVLLRASVHTLVLLVVQRYLDVIKPGFIRISGNERARVRPG